MEILLTIQKTPTFKSELLKIKRFFLMAALKFKLYNLIKHKNRNKNKMFETFETKEKRNKNTTFYMNKIQNIVYINE